LAAKEGIQYKENLLDKLHQLQIKTNIIQAIFLLNLKLTKKIFYWTKQLLVSVIDIEKFVCLTEVQKRFVSAWAIIVQFHD
jgi:hypothetical protein